MYTTLISTLMLVAGSAPARSALAGLVAERVSGYLSGKIFNPATQTKL